MTTGSTEKFEYHAPSTIDEALRLLEGYEGRAKILAGGHSLIPVMKLRLAAPDALIDLKNIAELRGISDNGMLDIGAMSTYHELEKSEIVRKRAPLIAETVSEVADVQVRNWGTIGGAICHSDPAGDSTAAALVLEAQMCIVASGVSRTVSAEDMFVGFMSTALDPNEILTRIKVPFLPPGTGCAYMKLENKASHYALVGVATAITLDASGVCSRARIGITGVGAWARRALKAEQTLVGQTPSDTVIHEIASLSAAEYTGEFNDDIHASAEYREAMTKVFVRRSIAKAAERAQNTLN